jgi:transposase
LKYAVAKDHNILLVAAPPKSPNINAVERDVQTIDNKQNATIAIQGSTMGDSIWFCSHGGNTIT